MLDKKDLNKYNTASSSSPSQRAEGELSQSAAATAKTVGGMAWKALKTILCVLFISGVLVFLSVAAFLLSFRDIEAPNLSAMSLNYSSFVYVDDEAGNATEYMTIHADENRVWASLSDIPSYMKTAQVCIEDHRFCEHSGVDWRTTLNAVLKLFSGGSGGGWAIGVLPDEAQLSRMLHSADCGLVVRRFCAVARYADRRGVHERNLSDMRPTPFMIGVSGRHTITIRTVD